MRNPMGFLTHARELPARRPVAVRLGDRRDVYEPARRGLLEDQAERCMDCGVPFCHQGCPLGNLIPEWNGLLADGRLGEAIDRLHATNNFPEFTGAICPAPCEAACVLGIGDDPVTIERIELEIATRAFEEGLVTPVVPSVLTGRAVAIVGSGPAGLAAAQQLRRAGHEVVVFERAERPGGLLRYGIPPFKLDKSVLDRRLAQLSEEGVEFRCATQIGAQAQGFRPAGDAPTVVAAAELVAQFDAVVLATGATVPRELAVPGARLGGVVVALELLRGEQLYCDGAITAPWVSAKGARVVVIGGGDTGSDCLGTSLRQGAASVTQLEILPEPPTTRPASTPWPTYPAVLRTSSSQEEGGERRFATATVELTDRGDGSVGALAVRAADAGEDAPTDVIEADLVVLAMGFTGPEHAVVRDLGVALTPAGTVAVDDSFTTSVAKIFACGDAVRGQSLVVWAIAEGRAVARAVDRFLTGEDVLPAPVAPTDRPLR